MGDILVMHAVIVTDADTRLDKLSLPLPGPLDAVTEIRDVAVEDVRQGGERRTTLTISYQTFLAAERVSQAYLPGYTLRFRRGEHVFEAHVPEWLFHVSPLRAAQRTQDEEGDLKPNHDVPPLPEQMAKLRFFASCGATLFAAIALAGSRGWLPGLGPTPPFSRAARRIARLAKSHMHRREVFQELHRAFDAVLGRRMFAEDIAAFLAAHAAYAPVRDEISTFFAESQKLFFGSAKNEEHLADVPRLARRLSRIERKW